MLGLNFPVSEYYKDHIQEGITVSRGGGWWTAVLLIEDPRTGNDFINMYSWQHKGDEWKTRKSFTIRSQKALGTITEALSDLCPRLPSGHPAGD